MTIPQLKAELTKYKLPVTGKRKEELVQRLQSYFECQLTGPIDFDFVGRVGFFGIYYVSVRYFRDQ